MLMLLYYLHQLMHRIDCNLKTLIDITCTLFSRVSISCQQHGSMWPKLKVHTNCLLVFCDNMLP